MTRLQSQSPFRAFSRRASTVSTLAIGTLIFAACGAEAPDVQRADATPARVAGTALRVQDTLLAATLDASGVAEPMQQATLSTKLMGTVVDVLVHEGDAVSTGQALLHIDARDLTAKSQQVAASIADAEAMQAEAATHAARFRALYADSAATRAQYDAAMTGLARADAGLRAARAASGELDAVRSYATVRAPFAGVVTMRFADAGTFAAPGAPLLTVQSTGTLRINAAVSTDAVRHLKSGQRLDASIDGVAVTALIEGIVPANVGNLFTVNALVDNRRAQYRAGSTAQLRIPLEARPTLLIPATALVREGDLVGVIVRGATRDERRWIRIGTTHGAMVEVTSGIVAGEEIVVPSATSTKAGA